MAGPQHRTPEHRAAVAQCRRIVDAGNGWCMEILCLVERDGGSRYIPPGSDVDAAHDRDNPDQYLGPAHPRCNRAEGGRWRHRKPAVKRWAL